MAGSKTAAAAMLGIKREREAPLIIVSSKKLAG
jgi:hypothetical protein